MIFNPSEFLRKILPKSFWTRKLFDVKQGEIKKKQYQTIVRAVVIDDEVETTKTDLNKTIARATSIYDRADNESTDDSYLKNNIENLLVSDKVETIKKDNKGKFYKWLPSDANIPSPEHQLLYGKVFKVGKGDSKGNMPGERFGCRCGMQILD